MKPSTVPWIPTKEQLQRAARRRLPDLLRDRLEIVFCGINPGLYSAAVGHHFARPGNRFWPTLHGAGFTPRLFSPFEDHLLLELGFGLTNIVARTTASADQLSADELRQGARVLVRKMRRWRPRILAVLGFTAYRAAFGEPRAVLGLQPRRIAETEIWLLPNPSGLNAHFPPRQLVDACVALRRYVRPKGRFT